MPFEFSTGNLDAAVLMSGCKKKSHVRGLKSTWDVNRVCLFVVFLLKA